MKIVAWNLNHRILMKAIPESLLAVVRELAPDIIVFTEYVDGVERAEFRERLSAIGPYQVTVSKKRPRHNQVLVATRMQHVLSELEAPTSDSHAVTNFLPIVIPSLDLTLVGLRAPAYETSAQTNEYWAGAMQRFEEHRASRIILVGDLNADPYAPGSVGGKALKTLIEKGWHVPAPAGLWSYISSDGKHTSRVDHLVASPSLGGVTASYETKVGGISVAGPKELNPISDHAILVCDIQIEPSAQSELIVRIASEGGGICLYGARTATGWRFSRDVFDHTPELIDETAIEHSSEVVDSWQAALNLLDRHPWYMLRPLEIHPEFAGALLAAAETRFAERGESGGRLGYWRNKCNEANLSA